MAKSHTGHLTGSDAVTSAVFRQFGITRVDGLDELQDTAALLSQARAADAPTGCASTPSPAAPAPTWPTWPPPAGCAPALDRRDAGGAARVDPRLPAGVEPGRQRRGAVDRLAGPQDPRRDRRRPERRRADLPDHRRAADDEPTAGRGPGRRGRDHRQADLRHLGLAGHRRPGLHRGARRARGCRSSARSATASARCKACFDHHEFRARYRSPFAEPVTERAPGARPSTSCCSPPFWRQLVARTGSRRACALRAHVEGAARRLRHPVTATCCATRPPRPLKAAGQIGCPVVMKACSAELAHKSDLGLVAVGVGSAAEVRSTYDELVDALADRHSTGSLGVPHGRAPGVETVVGVVARRAVRPGGDVRPRRRVRRGARRRDVPGAAVRPGRGPPHGRRGRRASRCSTGARGRPPADSRRWST